MVGYRVETAAPHEPSIDETPLEQLLEKAVHRGVVAPGQYDTGRGRLVWWNGWPGAAMRELKARILATVARLRAARS